MGSLTNQGIYYTGSITNRGIYHTEAKSYLMLTSSSGQANVGFRTIAKRDLLCGFGITLHIRLAFGQRNMEI